ncbi:MAG: HPr kinase/phosphatase C-terminal domain-containing protein [Alphaproteobacteria bacterium]|nr:HPr kinase/phosphatase C-terminal domain-containing protein [Alphaproteobacteria bacterium]MCY4231237.1 HPr kinase/phosphatase C-terminal domain-containing protein [Alphaproteobacteria bacterium]MCY4319458.1 HPr kinase/phosphatase C-terminal domain-containing protein [Alphaproteobacteria bacterium]
MRVHASCVAFEGWGVLLRGPSGSGKSDLALRAVEAGARLVADDLVVLERRGEQVWARALPQAGGRLEARGIGIVRLAALEGAPLILIADLAPLDRLAERLPVPCFEPMLGLAVRRIRLAPFEISAAIKLRLAAHTASEDKDATRASGKDDSW